MKLYSLISGLFLLSFVLLNCSNTKKQTVDEVQSSFLNPEDVELNIDTIVPVVKSESEWAAELSQKEFYVLRKKGTERAFTGDLLNNKEQGVYVCRGCQLPLFESETKYKSGTGWPSYYKPIKEEHIKEDVDYDLGYARTEVLCARCDGHLGHVFPDGPKPTGLRYCINSVSLDFVAKTNK